MKRSLFFTISLLLLTACSVFENNHSESAINRNAVFYWLDYSGRDEVFATPLASDEFRNPILTGFHPDPSIVRVGEDHYLVNSTFGFFPGIPVFHSRDLTNWTQIGNAIHRPDQLNYQGISLGGAGVYAATIEYRDGVFYVANTCVGCGGNFVVTATDPAGPWSDPIWMPHIEGIDPSIFFDDDGKTYIVHHRNPAQPKYPAHTALWVMEVDPVTFAPLSEDVMLVDGAEPAPWHTEYIEGPHIYKVGGTYYLSAPGGGTGYYHGQLLYRSDNVFGPYEANPDNPVLTQFGLPDDREHPVTATGHADLFEDTNGDWWAVFLGTRVYDLETPPQDPGNFHTGRETFMLPVTWKDGWPVILEKGKSVPYAVKRPNLPLSPPADRAMTGNFSVHETFDKGELDPHWLFVRAPQSTWWQVGEGVLELMPRTDRLGDYGQPSFVGRRLAHMTASITTKLGFSPVSTGDEAGILALQNDDYYYAFGLGMDDAGDRVLRIRKREGKSQAARGKTMAEVRVDKGKTVYLRMEVDKESLDFLYSLDGREFQLLLGNADSKVLTSAKANGFTGAVIGMYAEGGIEQ